jgi:hypothetical protein
MMMTNQNKNVILVKGIYLIKGLRGMMIWRRLQAEEHHLQGEAIKRQPENQAPKGKKRQPVRPGKSKIAHYFTI